MYVEIKSSEVKNQRDYKGELYGEQQAALVTPGADYPLPFKINRKVSDALKPGRYNISGDSFATDQHGNLRLNRLRLDPQPVAGKSVM